MPIIKSAKAKLKKDKKKTKINEKYRQAYKKTLQTIKNKKEKTGIQDLLKNAYSAIDKAVKQKVIPKNRGARLKSRVSRLAKKK